MVLTHRLQWLKPGPCITNYDCFSNIVFYCETEHTHIKVRPK